MIISAHWIGCLFFFTCELQEQTGGSPWCSAQDDIRDGTGSERLLIAFHTAFLMLIGENIGPTSPVEYAYTVVALIVGQIISAVVIGNISIVLNNQASMSALYTQKMDRVNESMMTLKLPSSIQTKGKEEEKRERERESCCCVCCSCSDFFCFLFFLTRFFLFSLSNSNFTSTSTSLLPLRFFVHRSLFSFVLFLNALLSAYFLRVHVEPPSCAGWQ